MKRSLVWILLLASCAVSVIAFWNRLSLVRLGSEGPPPEEPKTEIRVALYDWTQNLEVRNAVESYNETNTDQIEIVMMDIPSDAYNDTLNMLMTSGKAPDVFGVDPAWLPAYVNKNYLLNLTPSLDRSFLERFPSWAVEMAKKPLFKGGIYFLTSGVETVRLIYNKNLFRQAGLDPEKPPATFEEMELAARRIAAAGIGVKKYGFALPAGDSQHSFQIDLEASSTFSGITLYNFRTGQYDLSGYKPWLNMVSRMKAEGSLYPGESLLNRDMALRQFADGNIGMMYVTSGDYVKLQQYEPKEEWAAVMPPAARKERGAGALMMLPQSQLVVNASAQNAEKAVKVWKFLHSAAFQSVLFRQALIFPVIDRTRESSELAPGFSRFKEFYPTEADAVYPLFPQIMDQYDPNTVATGPRNSGDRPRMQLYLKIITGEKPPDQALQEETDRLNELLAIATTGNSFKREDYIIPGFDPLHPLSKLSQ
ncbi:ABC transporter substrate-binding protein [Paenibacillus caui]|uniref:ABC transporter substrate-binding protein n=1 Tax=Paenibacillus caui TaxID=2873927 RepID=UPI001CA89A17|nr:extracellular solute-binding protein [Paenibacillus caui]